MRSSSIYIKIFYPCPTKERGYYRHRYISTISPLTCLASGHTLPKTCNAPTPSSILALRASSFSRSLSRGSVAWFFNESGELRPTKAATCTTTAIANPQVKNGVREMTELGRVARLERRSAARRSFWLCVFVLGVRWGMWVLVLAWEIGWVWKRVQEVDVEVGGSIDDELLIVVAW